MILTLDFDGLSPFLFLFVSHGCLTNDLCETIRVERTRRTITSEHKGKPNPKVLEQQIIRKNLLRLVALPNNFTRQPETLRDIAVEECTIVLLKKRTESTPIFIFFLIKQNAFINYIRKLILVQKPLKYEKVSVKKIVNL
jgi:hypothetical protein